MLTEPSKWPTEAKPFDSTLLPDIPPILDTFYIVLSRLLFENERQTSCISVMPDASMLPTAFETLISNNKIFLSVPTLIANEPSGAILIELISPVWPLRDAIY